MNDLPFNIDTLIELVTIPSFETIQYVVVIYLGLLWLAVIIWVARDAINRSSSLIFQVIAILLNILFPILGILLYLIIRPGKTTLEKYYEDIEHRLIMESIEEKKPENEKVKKEENDEMPAFPIKMMHKKISKKSKKK